MARVHVGSHMSQLRVTVARIYAGLILCFFAFVPAWILVHLLLDLIDPTEKPTYSFRDAISFLGALAVCLALFTFLVLLAYRAFTGRGRQSDGGLLPPLALQAFAMLLGIVAVGAVALGAYHGNLLAIEGGIPYIGAAATVYGLARWRRIKARSNA